MNLWTLFDRFKETQLPPKESYYFSLSDEGITDENYQHAQELWRLFDCQYDFFYTYILLAWGGVCRRCICWVSGEIQKKIWRCVKIMSLRRLKRSIENWVFFSHLFILFLYFRIYLCLSLSLFLSLSLSLSLCLSLSFAF